jgi:signal transduction histidine kinase
VQAVLPSSYKPIRQGGAEFVAWLKQVLGSFLEKHELLAFGGTVVPQLGDRAGEDTSFRTDKVSAFSQLSLKTIDHQFSSMEVSEFRSIPLAVKTTTISHPGLGNICIVSTFLFLQDDTRIGHIWYAAPHSIADQATPDLLRAAHFITTAVLCEKMMISVEYLASPFWRTSNKLVETAKAAVDACMACLGCLTAVVWIADEASRTLRRLASKGNLPEDRSLEVPFNHGVAGHCYTNEKSLVVDDLQNEEHLRSKFGIKEVHNPKLIKELNWRSGIFVPLDAGDRIIGVMAVYGPRVKGFSHYEESILQAFAQRITAVYVYTNRLDELLRIEAQVKLEAPAIRTGLIAIKRVHDADNNLTMAQSGLSTLTGLYRYEKTSRVYTNAIAVSAHIDQAHRVLREMVAEARNFDRLRVGRRNVREFLSGIIARYNPDCVPHHIRISLNCAEDIDFFIDERQLSRAISNIVENAIEFLQADTKPGSKRINIDVRSEADKVIVRIKDNGPGIEPGKESEIFKLFFTTRVGKGLGFGLGIAKDIVEQHEGKIAVSSDWGMETTFTLTLPQNLNQ